jgi:hypothetical protein
MTVTTIEIISFCLSIIAFVSSTILFVFHTLETKHDELKLQIQLQKYIRASICDIINIKHGPDTCRPVDNVGIVVTKPEIDITNI